MSGITMEKNPKAKRISILLLEDDPSDAEMIAARLTHDGIEFTMRTAGTGDDYVKALGLQEPDIILADYHIPSFDGDTALDMALEKFPGIPFVYVTGTIGEEKAVETIRRGATDCVLKGNLARLAPAVRRAIKERNMLRDRQALFDALKESEERYKSLVENIPVGVFRSSIAGSGRILQANPALVRLYGADSVTEILDLSISDLYLDNSEREEIIRDFIEKGFTDRRQLRLKRKDGAVRWASVTGSVHRNSSGRVDWVDGIIEDISEKKAAEEDLRASYRFLETLIDTINSPVFYKDVRGAYLGCNRAFADMVIGLPREKIIGSTVFDMPEAIPRELAQKYSSKDRELFGNPGVQVYEARVMCADGQYHSFQFNKATFSGADGGIAGIVGVMLDITDRVDAEIELRRKHEELDLLLNSINSIIIGVSVKDRITHWNPYAENLFGIPSESALNLPFVKCGIDWDWVLIYEAISECISMGKTVRIDDVKYVRIDGREGLLGLTFNPLSRGGDLLEGFIILGQELTERRRMEQQLLHARKLEAIGQLAAGVSHEINSPLQYVGDNLRFMIKSIGDIMELQKMFVAHLESAGGDGSCRDTATSLREFMAAVDLDYLMRELPKAAAQSLEGVERVSKIVQSMKAFAHPGAGTKVPADINRSIENTATVSRNEWKYVAELELDLDPSLPMVPCFEAELNQVVLNLIVNAVDAIGEAKEKGAIERGVLRIRTVREGDFAVIRVEDNGAGIPENIKGKVFDPFFTTKEVGKGTGQGLPISHSIIVDKHGGMLYFESEPGRGTSFVIRLPLSEKNGGGP